MVQITDDPSRFEYADILTRHALDELTIEGKSVGPRASARGSGPPVLTRDEPPADQE